VSESERKAAIVNSSSASGTASYHPAVLRALKDFNSGRYFEAHEHLEETLDDVEEQPTVWELFLGLIQIAVGYHKSASGYPGSEKMLRLGLKKVASLPEVCASVRLEELRQRVREDLADGARVQERLRNDPPRITLVKNGG
jgi:predicted metal-dependent hydrolase